MSPYSFELNKNETANWSQTHCYFRVIQVDRWCAVRIVSFSLSQNCDYPNFPNFYTEISKYKEWINEVIRGGAWCNENAFYSRSAKVSCYGAMFMLARKEKNNKNSLNNDIAFFLSKAPLQRERNQLGACLILNHC